MENNHETGNTITFPMSANAQLLRAAVVIALADEDFMGNNKKVNNAVEVLTPKDTLTATLKRLQGNANKDFLDKKDKAVIGYTEQTRAEKIKAYVQDRFQSYMDDPKTSEKATKLFIAAYPPKAVGEDPVEGTVGE
jgi:hypothetical protein